MGNLDFLLSEYEERTKDLEDSLEKKVKKLGDVNKKLEEANKIVNSTKIDSAFLKLKQILGFKPLNDFLENEDFAEDSFRIQLKSPDDFSKLKIVTVNQALGIKAVIGYTNDFNGETQAYIFEKLYWTNEAAQRWVNSNSSKSLNDIILIEKLKGLDSKKQKDVFLADSIQVDAWVDVSGGTVFKDVVFAKEGVQKYRDGMHFKPAKELKAALDSFRGKPIVAYEHPTAKVVTSMGQQIGHIVFDTVKWDSKKNRPYGDIFVKKEKKTKGIIDAIKNKRLQDNSIGFRCDIENKPGEFNGIHYDKVQTNFFIDHLALVMRGRSGSEDGVGINAY